ncbi:hypothetical protein [Bifidobacterium xylocopae]|uniref:Uncharacterized protein n=1 Tax=Bifidobacterium xylocopae TaxID=2493119 RepID=A0A366KEM7_9BIFI|nr:hypothetical protein [Bifidobacterium xylocopae]RBP99692.1 hypothetical protein CRD59_02920 [Bifidobacterium xylocopae]
MMNLILTIYYIYIGIVPIVGARIFLGHGSSKRWSTYLPAASPTTSSPERIAGRMDLRIRRIGPVKIDVEAATGATVIENRLLDAIIAYNNLIAAGPTNRLQADGLHILRPVGHRLR